MRSPQRISRRKSVAMGDATTGIFQSHYELSAIKWRGPKQANTCLKTIMCACERRRCPGRTLSHSYYIKTMGNN